MNPSIEQYCNNGNRGVMEYVKLKIIATFLRLATSLWWIFVGDGLVPGGTKPQRLEIPSREKNRFIQGHLYCPQSTRKGPVLVNWHGSGFVLHWLGTDVAFCSQVAKEADMFVLDVDYRKGPENPFPAAIHDVQDVLAWVAAHPDRFDLGRVALSGFSAGGNLALVASSSLRRDIHPIQVPIVVSVYPPTDLARNEKEQPNRAPAMQTALSTFFDNCYTPDPATRRDPRVSPLYADASLFPQTVVLVTCEKDGLLLEGNKLAAKLDDGERRLVHTVVRGGHCYDKACWRGSSNWEQREASYALIISELRRAVV